MILQPASQREVKRIAVGTLVCDALMVAGLFLASQFDIGTFDLGKILLSAAIGSVIGRLYIAQFAYPEAFAGVDVDAVYQQFCTEFMGAEFAGSGAYAG